MGRSQTGYSSVSHLSSARSCPTSFLLKVRVVPLPELARPLALWPFQWVCPFASSDPLLPAPAVRTGNLAKFNQVLDQFGEKFQADGTYTLIIRLRHNVIKTGVDLSLRGCWKSRTQISSCKGWRQPCGCPWVGRGSVASLPTPVLLPLPGVRMISLSYSRISLADIAQKLQLDSPEDAEFIVAKVGPVPGLQLLPSCHISRGGNGRLAKEGNGFSSGMVFSGSSWPYNEARKLPESVCT